MSVKDIFIKSGFWMKSSDDLTSKGGLSLKRAVRYMLTKLHVSYYDDCCATADSTASLPVVYDSTLGQLKFYDGSTSSTVSTTGSLAASGAVVAFSKPLVQKSTASAINSSATASTAQLAGGLITSTSVAAVTLTLPTASSFATAIGATKGTMFDFFVDNTSGANTVTVTVNTGITAITAVVTGGATLTVGSGTIGQFRLIFTSTTTAKLARIA